MNYDLPRCFIRHFCCEPDENMRSRSVHAVYTKFDDFRDICLVKGMTRYKEPRPSLL